MPRRASMLLTVSLLLSLTHVSQVTVTTLSHQGHVACHLDDDTRWQAVLPNDRVDHFSGLDQCSSDQRVREVRRRRQLVDLRRLVLSNVSASDHGFVLVGAFLQMWNHP